jgi:glycosyltransferase involved in cell wall biosynthesis
VATVHSDFAAEYPGLKGKLYSGVLTATQPVVSHTINVTEVLQKQAELRGQGQHSTLIPNAVPVPGAPLGARRHDLAAGWGFDAADFVVGIVGRLVPVKGHQYLIRALARLEDVPHVKLVVVGTGGLEHTLKQLAHERNLDNRVVFTGFRQDIPAVMQNIDCLCMASLSEALPYVILEAASYARPLVVTRVGGLETLLADGETALMVPPQDADALAVALRRLANDRDLAARLGRGGYALVKERFSLQRMMTDVLRVYDG